MNFSGTNILVKLRGGPFPTPVLNSKFTFPITKLEVSIEKGKLLYMTTDGTDVQGVHGFCMDVQAGAPVQDSSITRSQCEDMKWSGQGNTTNTTHSSFGGGPLVQAYANYEWVPYVQASTATNVEEIQLSHQHLKDALAIMMKYYEDAYIQLDDYNALYEWYMEIKQKLIDYENLNLRGGMSQFRKGKFNQQSKLVTSVDIGTKRILDAIAITFTSEQSSIPIYSPGNQLMGTQMRGNTMIQGSISLNFDSFDVLDLINHDKLMHLEIVYFNDELEKEDYLEYPEYELNTKGRLYTLRDIKFISKSHAVSPSPENVVENYQFIAKDLSYDNPII